jgi:hypothetical protein
MPSMPQSLEINPIEGIDMVTAAGMNRNEGAALTQYDSSVTIPYKDVELTDRSRVPVRISIFEHGVKTQHLGRTYNKPKTSKVRGRISGFSIKAASRLRAYCIENEVIEHQAFAHTWTTRGLFGPDEWRGIMRRMRRRCRRLRIPAIWRVQLQRGRPTPHLHCTCFVSDSAQNVQLRTAWLECTGEHHDQHAQRYAVRYRPVESAGWAAYMAQRRSAHAIEQYGWVGKQWGVWCRDKFTACQPIVHDISLRQSDRFRRTVERMIVPKNAKKISRRKLPRNRNWRCCVNGLTAERALRLAMSPDHARPPSIYPRYHVAGRPGQIKAPLS